MDKIVCLVGESGSGKTTIALELEKEGYNFIESYTDRPKRYLEERGHIFVNQFMEWLFDNQCAGIIAETVFDGHTYWSTKEQYQGKGTSIYIIDPVGVKTLKQNVKDAEIVVIYLKADIEVREDRMYERKLGKLNDVWKRQDDIEERLEHDLEAFKLIECNYCIDANRPVEEVLELVKQVIEGDKLD